MHGIEEGLLDKGCAEASDLLYIYPVWCNRLHLLILAVCLVISCNKGRWQIDRG